jgi:hypothetical protein
LSVERGDRNNPGTPRVTRLAKPVTTTTGPAWFQAMDRNADGDLSRGEFLGTQQQFLHLDHNRDSFIDAAEAATASAGAP